MKKPVEHLERVDPASLWASESGDFLPWLAMGKNLCRLGDALGLDLEPVAREAMVGRFRADLVCRDRDSGNTVVIEARLGHSDHSHLGQLLTYGVGLRGDIVVWLATAFHDEHRAVIGRLNERDGSGFRCFAVELRTWRIGASPAAPQFTVVAGPGDWSGPGPGAGEAHLAWNVAELDRLEENPVKARRLNSGLSMRQLAKSVGISRGHLAHIESGRRRGSPATLAAIARALNAADRRDGPGTPRAMNPETGDEPRTEA